MGKNRRERKRKENEAKRSFLYKEIVGEVVIKYDTKGIKGHMIPHLRKILRRVLKPAFPSLPFIVDFIIELAISDGKEKRKDQGENQNQNQRWSEGNYFQPRQPLTYNSNDCCLL